MIEFYKDREFGEIFQETFMFFKHEIKTIITILFIFAVPFSLYGVYFMFKFQDILQQELQKSFQTHNFSNIPNEFYIFLGFSILQQILTILSISAFIKLKVNDEPISIPNIFGIIQMSFTNVFAGQMFIFTAIFTVFFLVAVTGLISFRIFVLIIWSIYVLVSMYFLSFIIIFEEISVINAIKRSLQLIKGNWWFTFGSIIVFGIIVGLSELIISSIITSIISVVSKGDVAAIVVLLASAFVSVVLSAISVIVPAYLYASFATKTNSEIDIY
jgi:hypothetical protein